VSGWGSTLIEAGGWGMGWGFAEGKQGRRTLEMYINKMTNKNKNEKIKIKKNPGGKMMCTLCVNVKLSFSEQKLKERRGQTHCPCVSTPREILLEVDRGGQRHEALGSSSPSSVSLSFCFYHF
jgi:nicotinic acid phosphoribosyltransferase